MANIIEKGLVETLQNLTQPVLGFCLGMQLMTRSSTEGVNSTEGISSTEGVNSTKDGKEAIINCLNIIPTKVKQLQSQGKRLPHMGWNTLENLTDDPLLHGINTGDYVYFVHSFAASVGDKTLATTSYGQPFSAIIKQDNIYGCQFHPERSGQTGAKILANFLKVKP